MTDYQKEKLAVSLRKARDRVIAGYEDVTETCDDIGREIPGREAHSKRTDVSSWTDDMLLGEAVYCMAKSRACLNELNKRLTGRETDGGFIRRDDPITAG